MKKSQTDSTVLAQRFASSNKEKPLLVVIKGPTSTGKTSYSIELAKKLEKLGIHTEIVSADSRQVYKGLDLLSGKVTKKEMSKIPHHMLSIASPKRKYSAANYKKSAEKAISKIHKNGGLPILVGGTGFYIDTITKGLVLPEVKPNQSLRKSLENKTLTELSNTLKKLDVERWQTVDKSNKVRLIRAVEIAKALGKVPKAVSVSKYDLCEIYIDKEDAELKNLIHKRILQRIKQGMVNEAKILLKDGVSHKRLRELGLECKYMSLYILGEITKEKMIEELARDTWQYVKRQRTWFKKTI